jgi:hypothetical protein
MFFHVFPTILHQQFPRKPSDVQAIPEVGYETITREKPRIVANTIHSKITLFGGIFATSKQFLSFCLQKKFE